VTCAFTGRSALLGGSQGNRVFSAGCIPMGGATPEIAFEA